MKAIYVSDEVHEVVRAAAFVSCLTIGSLAGDCILKCLKVPPKRRKLARKEIVYNAKA